MCQMSYTIIVMDSKMQRYMQRIQRLISIPNRTASPLRPSKSPLTCRTSHLDKYLKYELSAKMISGFIHRRHQGLKGHFFAATRQAQPAQIERIYRFVAVEKDHSSLKVDINIAAKIMLTALKQPLRARLKLLMQAVRRRVQGQFSPAGASPETVQRNKSRMRSTTEWVMDTPAASKQEIKSATNFALKSMSRCIMRIGLGKIRDCFRIILSKGSQKELTSLRAKLLQSEEDINQVSSSINRSLPPQTIQLQQADQHQLIQLQESHRAHLSQMERVSAKQLQSMYFLKLKLLICSYHSRHKHKTISMLSALFPLPSYIDCQLQLRTTKVEQALSILRNTYHSHLKDALSKMRTYHHLLDVKVLVAQIILNKLVAVHSRFRLTRGHFFLSRLQEGAQLSAIQSHPKSKTGPIELSIQTPKSLRKVHLPVEGKNIFEGLVHKMVRMILIISKLLIPIKDAFQQIDNHAYFCYQLEESLKVYPKAYLRDALRAIKAESDHSEVNSFKVAAIIEEESPISVFANLINDLVNQRLVDSYSHIKVAAKEREFKIKVIPAQLSVVDIAGALLSETQQVHTNQVQEWQHLRESILGMVVSSGIKSNRQEAKE